LKLPAVACAARFAFQLRHSPSSPAFAGAGCFPKDAVHIEGTLRDYRSIADSGNIMHRRFCPACGTQVFSESEARPTLTFVRAGTLDDSEVAQPSATIWTSEAPSWACINQDLPRVAAQPPPIA